jgi:hypothetical protein
LVLFHDHQILAALHQLLARNGPLSQQSIHGGDCSPHSASTEQKWDGCDPVALVPNLDLPQDVVTLVMSNANEMDSGTMRRCAPHIFAVYRLAAPDCSICTREAAQSLVVVVRVPIMQSNLMLKGVDVYDTLMTTRRKVA